VDGSQTTAFLGIMLVKRLGLEDDKTAGHVVGQIAGELVRDHRFRLPYFEETEDLHVPPIRYFYPLVFALGVDDP